MSFLWLLPTAVLVLGSVMCARVALGLRDDAVDVEVALAEAAEAIAVVAASGSQLDETSERLEHVIGAVGSPLRVARQVRSTTRHWWRRARRSSVAPDVPSTP